MSEQMKIIHACNRPIGYKNILSNYLILDKYLKEFFGKDIIIIESTTELVELKAENKRLKRIVSCKYSHEFKILGDGYCNKCGWFQPR